MSRQGDGDIVIYLDDSQFGSCTDAELQALAERLSVQFNGLKARAKDGQHLFETLDSLAQTLTAADLLASDFTLADYLSSDQEEDSEAPSLDSFSMTSDSKNPSLTHRNPVPREESKFDGKNFDSDSQEISAIEESESLKESKLMVRDELMGEHLQLDKQSQQNLS